MTPLQFLTNARQAPKFNKMGASIRVVVGEQYPDEDDEDTFLRTCKTCKLEKLNGEFYKHPRHKDGYETECKACRDFRCKKRKLEHALLKQPH